MSDCGPGASSVCASNRGIFGERSLNHATDHRGHARRPPSPSRKGRGRGHEAAETDLSGEGRMRGRGKVMERMPGGDGKILGFVDASE